MAALAAIGLMALAPAGRTQPERTGREAISTPTADVLRRERRQARVGPLGATAVVATGLALQMSGAVKDGRIVIPASGHQHRRIVDLARTDASVVPLKPFRPAPPGKPRTGSIDPATLSAAGYPAPPATMPFVLKLPPGMN